LLVVQPGTLDNLFTKRRPIATNRPTSSRASASETRPRTSLTSPARHQSGNSPAFGPDCGVRNSAARAL